MESSIEVNDGFGVAHNTQTVHWGEASPCKEAGGVYVDNQCTGSDCSVQTGNSIRGQTRVAHLDEVGLRQAVAKVGVKPTQNPYGNPLNTYMLTSKIVMYVGDPFLSKELPSNIYANIETGIMYRQEQLETPQQFSDIDTFNKWLEIGNAVVKAGHLNASTWAQVVNRTQAKYQTFYSHTQAAPISNTATCGVAVSQQFNPVVHQDKQAALMDVQRFYQEYLAEISRKLDITLNSPLPDSVRSLDLDLKATAPTDSIVFTCEIESCTQGISDNPMPTKEASKELGVDPLDLDFPESPLSPQYLRMRTVASGGNKHRTYIMDFAPRKGCSFTVEQTVRIVADFYKSWAKQYNLVTEVYTDSINPYWVRNALTAVQLAIVVNGSDDMVKAASQLVGRNQGIVIALNGAF
jgi:hypothetical protein